MSSTLFNTRTCTIAFVVIVGSLVVLRSIVPFNICELAVKMRIDATMFFLLLGPSLPWHKTPEWERFLSLYDDTAEKGYGSRSECSSRMVDTSFGSTQTHSCGDSEADPVILLHGATDTGLTYADWIGPDIVANGNYAVAIDFVCDRGRSVPLDGDPRNCPQDQESLARWVKEVIDGLGIVKPVSLVGYSYGGFIASTVVKFEPELVDKVALLVPGGVLAPIRFEFVFNVIRATMIESYHESLYRYISGDPEYDPTTTTIANERNHDTTWWPLRVASAATKGTILSVLPVAMEGSELADMAKNHPTKLFITSNEVATSPSLALERAKRAGIQTSVYPRNGHLLFLEPIRDQVSLDVAAFLTNGTVVG